MSKNPEQQARGKLGPKANGNDYADARTRLALEQAARQRQIRRAAAGELIEVEEVRQVLGTCIITLSSAHKQIVKRFRAAYPDSTPDQIAFLERELADAMSMLSDTLRNLKKEKAVEDEDDEPQSEAGV